MIDNGSQDRRSLPSDHGEQPWLHHLATSVDGPLTALSAQDGSIGEGAEGVYLDDVRIISILRARLSGSPLTQVAWAAEGSQAEFFCSARMLGNPGPDPSVELLRRRELRGPRLVETFVLTSRASSTVRTTLTVDLGADGLDVALVKHGVTTSTPQRISVTGPTATWQTDRHESTLHWDPPPATHVATTTGTQARFPLDVPPGGQVSVRLTVDTVRTSPSRLDADSGSARLDQLGTFDISADDPRVLPAVRGSLRDVQHLALTDPLSPDDVFLAAGTPWYLTLFGRDSIWAARMLLPLSIDLALGTLRTLARRQGTKVDPELAEEPGKIPHEVRRAEADAGLVLPPVYYGTVDATSLWLSLLDDAVSWGLPSADVTTLLPAVRGALTWLTSYAAPDADGLIKYVDRSGSGLVNQGWKDSGDCIRFRDGTIADAPIALIEAQAYAVQAARAGARLLREFGTGSDGAPGDADLCAAAELRADRLTEAVRDRFWVRTSDGDWPAIAVDGHGDPVTGIGSNMGHCLGTGVFNEDEVKSVAATLMAPNLLGDFGIRTLATDNGGFNPIGYHTGSVWIHDTAICALGLAAEGLHAQAAQVTARMLAASESFDYRNPELYGDSGVLGRPIPYPASCRPQAWSAASSIAMLTAGLALSCDARSRTLRVGNPVSPFGAIRCDGLQVAGERVTLTIDRDGETDVEGLPPGWQLVVG